MLFNFQSIVAQDTILYDRMGDRLCNCLNKDSEKVTKELFSKCVENTIEDHQASIDSLVVQEINEQKGERMPDNWISFRISTKFIEYSLEQCEAVSDFYKELLVSERNLVESKIVDRACVLLKEKEEEGIELTIDIASDTFLEAYREYEYRIRELLDDQDNSTIESLIYKLHGNWSRECDIYKSIKF